MKYACVQSILFCKRFLLFYLPSHSNMAADRAIALAKQSLWYKNCTIRALFYTNKRIEEYEVRILDYQDAELPSWYD